MRAPRWPPLKVKGKPQPQAIIRIAKTAHDKGSLRRCRLELSTHAAADASLKSYFDRFGALPTWVGKADRSESEDRLVFGEDFAHRDVVRI